MLFNRVKGLTGGVPDHKFIAEVVKNSTITELSSNNEKIRRRNDWSVFLFPADVCCGFHGALITRCQAKASMLATGNYKIEEPQPMEHNPYFQQQFYQNFDPSRQYYPNPYQNMDAHADGASVDATSDEQKNLLRGDSGDSHAVVTSDRVQHSQQNGEHMNGNANGDINGIAHELESPGWQVAARKRKPVSKDKEKKTAPNGHSIPKNEPSQENKGNFVLWCCTLV